MSRPRIVVLGTGAMACWLGARLARAAEAHVTLAGTWPEGLAAIQARGITLEEEDHKSSVPVTALAVTELAVGQADFALVLVKAHRTAEVAAPAALATAPHGLVVTLQNGWGNREILAAEAGAGRVCAGVTTAGATLLGPGHVRAFPGSIMLGTAAGAEALARLFRGAGLAAHTVADIDRHLWRKLAVNCGINPLAALRGVTNGALVQDPEARARVVAAAREVGDVAAVRGTPLGADGGALALEVAERTGGNRSSMLQDLDRGAPTEIEALCGAVAREGRARGVPTPVNDDLLQRVREASCAVGAR